MRNTIFAFCLSAVAVPNLAAAAERNADDWLFLRGGVGVAEVDSQQDVGNDLAHSLGVGWGFLKYFSIDANYDTLGNWDKASPGIGGPLDAKTTSVSLGVGATVNFGNSGFFAQARAGVHNWETEYESFETKFTKDGTDPFYALGAGYDFNEYFGVLLSYERFVVDDQNLGDVDRIMLGFEVR